MAKRTRDRACIIMRRVAGPRLVAPASAFDAEQLEAIPLDAEVDVVLRTKRSLPQHRTYWKALSEVVTATGRWPTAEHLHDALKRDLGFIGVGTNLIGQPYIVTDSTAFDEMDQAEFQAYFDQAMARLAEVVGFDPLAFLEEAA